MGPLKLFRICRGDCWRSTDALRAAADDPSAEVHNGTVALFVRRGRGAIDRARQLQPAANDEDFVCSEETVVAAAHRGTDLDFHALSTTLSVLDDACAPKCSRAATCGALPSVMVSECDRV